MYYFHLLILKAHFEDNLSKVDKMGENYSSGMLSKLSLMKNQPATKENL